MEKGNILVLWKNKTKYHLMEYTEKNRASLLLYSCERYKNLKVMKDKEKLLDWKALKETWQLSVMCAPGLDLFVTRDIIGITGKTEWSLRIWC